MGNLSWMELDIGTRGDEVEIGVRSSRGHRPEPKTRGPLLTPQLLEGLKKLVGRAVSDSTPLDEKALKDAQAIYKAIFYEAQGQVREVAKELDEEHAETPVLHRLMLRDRFLHAVPWEALCEPGTSEGFWGTSPRVSLARGVWQTGPWERREVNSAVRVLAVAPHGADSSLDRLHAALKGSIAAGEIEWLEPIVGKMAGEKKLLESLEQRKNAKPHILHFIGHGRVGDQGHPELRLADDDDADDDEKERWIKAESLARELETSFRQSLSIVVLECCEGAKGGVLGSAAELFVKSGADAVIAHLWPIKADAAQRCSLALYSALTGATSTVGDVGASLAAARRSFLKGNAERFSPVLYLRGLDTVLLDFGNRSVVRPTQGTTIAPALDKLLKVPFSILVGDDGEDRQALRIQTEKYLIKAGDSENDLRRLSLGALMQRVALRFGEASLLSRFTESVNNRDLPVPPLLDALARRLRPGVHMTLLWQPLLERALLKRQPSRTIHVIQPSLLDSGNLPEIYRRTGGGSQWETDPLDPEDLLRNINLETDFVVLRLYGGYSAGSGLTVPLMTEDDHVFSMLGGGGVSPPDWALPFIANLQGAPEKRALFIGLSVLELRHRMVLRWIYSDRPAPMESVAILKPGCDPAEAGIWAKGGGLPGATHIATVQADSGALAAAVEKLPEEKLA